MFCLSQLHQFHSVLVRCLAHFVGHQLVIEVNRQGALRCLLELSGEGSRVRVGQDQTPHCAFVDIEFHAVLELQALQLVQALFQAGRGHVLVGHLLLGPIRSITRSAASLSLSMTRIEPVCYLSDLFTREAARGRGAGRALIEAVYDSARAAMSSRVYWQTHESNTAGRQLYDKLAKHHGFIVYAQEL